MKSLWILIAGALLSRAPPPELHVTLVGNAGVLLSDGATSLLVDLPYESGSFGYMTYAPEDLAPAGATLSVITHDHRDHFAAELFLERAEWKALGPPSVTAGLPADRVVQGDSVRIGDFSVVAIPTPHTPDHRSYRVRWRGRVLHFPGDTGSPDAVVDGPPLDILFVTPWLSCTAEEAGMLEGVARAIAYHLAPAGGDRVCGDAEVLPQGSTFTVAPR